jgi:hypothetical protein
VQPGRAYLLLVAALTLAALLIGIYARFKGLGKWPLGVDEYYTARSVQNILRAGLPEYACGGFYTRGLLVQYMAALLQLGGLSPELSIRLIAAASSLIALPAAYILARRIGGSVIALLAVTVLALSVWEVEMARFARMYAPFQAVFLWYAVFFVKYTVDRDTCALWPMLGLSLVGVLVWEGGVLLAATNLLPPFVNSSSGRLAARDLRYLAGVSVPLVTAYLFATSHLRTFSDQSPFPPGFVDPHIPQVISGLAIGTAPWTTLSAHPVWWALAAVPLIALGFALRWAFTFRERWATAVGLFAVLLAAALHQFGLVAALLVVLLLMRMLGWRELFSPAALPFGAAIGLSAASWIAFGLFTSDWRPDTAQSRLETVMLLGYEFVRVPDFVAHVALPWARAIPVLGIALFVLIAAACTRLIIRGEPGLTAERAVVILLVCLLLGASASSPPRSETRYVLFLYPLAVIIALVTLARAVEVAARLSPYGAKRAVFASLAGLVGFVFTEDFDLHHLRYVDSAAIHFRVRMEPFLAHHYYKRADVRTVANWLKQNTNEDDIVINSVQSLDFYFPRIDYFYMNSSDRRFSGWTCRGGTVERWGNTPLLYSIPALQAQFDKGKHVLYVIRRAELDDLLPHLARWRPRVVWDYDRMIILGFNAGTNATEAPAPSAEAGNERQPDRQRPTAVR